MDQQQIDELKAKIQLLKEQQEEHRNELLFLEQQLMKLLPAAPSPAIIKPVAHQSNQIRKTTQKDNGVEGFVGLRLMQFAGIIVLITGIAIGVKYAIDKNLISPAVRILLAYLASGLLLFISIRLRKKYETFSAILFSGAMAAFYFTTYGAFEYYGFLSRPLAFAVMILFTFFTVYVSLKFERQEIATLALVGAYGIPFLVGGNSGNVVMLFSYIFLINTGILYLSFKRSWNILKVLSFAASWLIFISWLFIKHNETYSGAAWLFLILFYVQFLLTIFGFRLARNEETDGADLLLLIFQSFIVYISSLYIYSYNSDKEDGSIVTLTISVFHLLLMFISKGLFHQQKMIWHTCLVLALILIVIYVPQKFAGTTISLVWVTMAVLLFVAGLWQRFRLLRIASILLFGITLVKLVVLDSINFSTIEKIVAYVSIGAILLVIAFLYQKYRHLIFGNDE